MDFSEQVSAELAPLNDMMQNKFNSSPQECMRRCNMNTWRFAACMEQSMNTLNKEQ